MSFNEIGAHPSFISSLYHCTTVPSAFLKIDLWGIDFILYILYYYIYYNIYNNINNRVYFLTKSEIADGTVVHWYTK